jgi:hypothetical protein
MVETIPECPWEGKKTHEQSEDAYLLSGLAGLVK